MRSAALIAVLMVSGSVGWIAENQADKRSLDVVYRRLEYIEKHTDGRVKDCATKGLYHGDPMLRRRKGPIGEKRHVILDSDDEKTLILEQYGYAGVATRKGFWASKYEAWWDSLVRWAWRQLPWALLLGVGYWMYLRRDQAVRQYHDIVEQQPQDIRERFAGRYTDREHARLKPKKPKA